MGEHRGERRPHWWRLRAVNAELRRQYADLARRYEALEADHVVLVGDLERRAGLPPLERRAPSWAQTQEIPLAPADAARLTQITGLLESPSGSLGQGEGTTG